MVDDESLNRRARGYEFQPELVSESFEESGTGEVKLRTRTFLYGLHPWRREVEFDVKSSL